MADIFCPGLCSGQSRDQDCDRAQLHFFLSVHTQMKTPPRFIKVLPTPKTPLVFKQAEGCPSSKRNSSCDLVYNEKIGDLDKLWYGYKMSYKHLEMCVGFSLTQLENMMVSQSQNSSLEPMWNETPPFFMAREKYPMGHAHILTLLELQISNRRACKYKQFPLMCTYRNDWTLARQSMQSLRWYMNDII